MTEGPSAASEKTGIDKGAISRRAKVNGMSTVVVAVTHAAVQTVSEQRALTRERVIAKMLDRAEAMLDWTAEPVTDYVGQQGREVVRPHPTGTEARNMAIAVAVLIDKHELLSNRATSHEEHEVTIYDAVRTDEHRAILRDALIHEALRRGLPVDAFVGQGTPRLVGGTDPSGE